MATFLQKYWILGFILILASFLRLVMLDKVPVGLHGDEASVGYTAYSLLKTGHDQNGNFFPLAIDQFGDFRPAGYHYVEIPFVGLMGLSIEATRLPSALFGIAMVFLLYLFVQELFEKRVISLISSALLAISPWHIVISRATSETVMAMFFVLLGSLFFVKGVKQKKYIGWFIGSFLSFSTSFFFYHAARVFVPIAFIPFALLCFGVYKADKKKLVVSGGLFILTLCSLLFFLVFGHGISRAGEVSIFNIPGGDQQLKQQMDEEGTLNPFINRFLHNKFYFYGSLFLYNYSQHFTGNFLFLDNGLPIRYKVPWNGNMYFVELPFILIGSAFLLTLGLKEKKYLFLVPIFWLIIGAIPAGLTYEDIPDVERASFMIPALSMITAYGIYTVFQFFKNKKILTLFGCVIGLLFLQGFLLFLNNYFYSSFLQEPWFRSASESDLLFNINSLDNNGKTPVVMTTQNNNNFIFYLFYNKFDPKQFQMMGSPRETDGLHFLNITYTYNSCPLSGSSQENASGNIGVIFVDKPDCSLPKNAVVLNTVRTPDGVPSFIIVTLPK